MFSGKHKGFSVIKIPLFLVVYYLPVDYFMVVQVVPVVDHSCELLHKEFCHWPCIVRFN